MRLSRVLSLFVAVFLLGVTSFAGAKRTGSQQVTVVINSPANTPENDKIYLTGAGDAVCNWRPICHPFQVVDRRARSLAVRFEVAAQESTLEFKVTRGSWSREPSDAAGNPLSNQILKLNGTKTFHVLNITNWTDQDPLGVTGSLVRLKNIHSPQLNNRRDVVVWLPPSYTRNSSKRYPVLYMHDGQNVFDPKTSTFGVDWDVDSAMTRLAQEGAPEAIVVGINNNAPDRFSEYDYTRKGAAYARFLIDTVKPMIDAKFRTLPGRESTFVGGSSMGALISVALVWKHPEIFSKAAALSLPAFIHDGSIFKVIASSPSPRLPYEIYIDHGNWGRDKGYKPHVAKFLQQMAKQGTQQNQIFYAEFHYHDHTEADWARRVSIPLRWMLEGQSGPRSKSDNKSPQRR